MKNKNRPEYFSPVRIGTTPGGSEWVAYAPEDVAPMRARLAAMWERVQDRAMRIEINPEGLGGRFAIVEAVRLFARNVATAWADGSSDVPPGVVRACGGQCMVEGSARFMGELASALDKVADRASQAAWNADRECSRALRTGREEDATNARAAHRRNARTASHARAESRRIRWILSDSLKVSG